MNATIDKELQAPVQKEAEYKKERMDKVDFKMVSFSLGGKDYGIDIMNVKEIAKAGKFTYVPNAAAFVRGVYNLRGEIISVIDLRIMFHLPAEKKEEEALESLLILRIDDHIFGVIVDSIDKVVGIASENIQPPHPIFGDINVKYIRGVVESNNKLYIILDIARIFSSKAKEVKEETRSPVVAESMMAISSRESQEVKQNIQDTGNLDLNFISETLYTFKHFGVSILNRDWLMSRFTEWKSIRKGQDLQLKEMEDAEQFLEHFYSPYTGKFWGNEYFDAIYSLLPDFQNKSLNVWNPGCGKGYETFSLACVLKKRYPDTRIKIWAHDSDLLNISTAPSLVFDLAEVPDTYQEYLVKGKNGYSFSQLIKDSVSFEYHDILNSNPLPPLDLVLCRDLLSFFSEEEQARVLQDFGDKIKAGGMVILGSNETLQGIENYKEITKDDLKAFIKE